MNSLSQLSMIFKRANLSPPVLSLSPCPLSPSPSLHFHEFTLSTLHNLQKRQSISSCSLSPSLSPCPPLPLYTSMNSLSQLSIIFKSANLSPVLSLSLSLSPSPSLHFHEFTLSNLHNFQKRTYSVHMACFSYRVLHTRPM